MNETRRMDQRESSRRGFLKLFTAALSALVALVLGIPLVGALVGSIYRTKKLRWARVSDIDSLPVGKPVKLSWRDIESDVFIRERVERDVWALKHSPTEVTVFSPICPHLGCRYDWHPDRNEFICPCHGSIYSINGKVLGGPAPRPLDTLPTRLENGELYVEWGRFVVGISEKIPV
jgi:menaquinol-cytochrome c reductase iron-sulfur subunit